MYRSLHTHVAFVRVEVVLLSRRSSSPSIHIHLTTTHSYVEFSQLAMGWLRLVGSIELQVTFAEYSLIYRSLSQKRPIISSILLFAATPYQTSQVACRKEDLEIYYQTTQKHHEPSNARQHKNTTNSMNQRRSEDLFSSLMLKAHNSVVQMVSFRYFRKIILYKCIVCFVPLDQIYYRLEVYRRQAGHRESGRA